MAEEYTRWNTLSETEAAAKLGIKQPSVHYLISTGALPVVEVPGFKVPRVPQVALENYVTRRDRRKFPHLAKEAAKLVEESYVPHPDGFKKGRDFLGPLIDVLEPMLKAHSAEVEMHS